MAERGEHHVVHGVRADAWASHTCSGVEVVPGPAIFRQIGILQAPLQATLRTLVELMPEAKGSFDDVVDVAGARAARARGGIGDRPARKSLRGAARVVEEGAAVADCERIARRIRNGVSRTR